MSSISEKNWAVIKAGGKQHVAQVGSKIIINQIKDEEGSTINSNNELSKELVSLKVLRHFLGKKINGLKFKNKVRYLKRYGHRQPLTELEVISIGSAKPKAEAASKEKPTTTKKAAAKKAVKKVKNG